MRGIEIEVKKKMFECLNGSNSNHFNKISY